MQKLSSISNPLSYNGPINNKPARACKGISEEVLSKIDNDKLASGMAFILSKYYLMQLDERW